MSAARFALVVLVCAAGLAAAQGTFPTCPSASSTSDDYFNVQSCTAVQACATIRCACNGGTFSNTTLTCSATGKTCAQALPCERAYIVCMQAISAQASCLNNLKVSVVNILAGTSYSGSSLQAACKADVCRYLNATVAANCTIDYDNICYVNSTSGSTLAPGVAKAICRIILSGGYANMLANPAFIAKFIELLNGDLTLYFLVQCNVTSYSGGSLIANFVANTAANDPTFAARLAAATNDASWLVGTSAQFSALGGTGTFGLQGISTLNAASSTLYAWSALAAIILAIFA